jgi:hypothetical protein
MTRDRRCAVVLVGNWRAGGRRRCHGTNRAFQNEVAYIQK